MSDDTIPPQNTPRNIGRRLWAWSYAHQMASAVIFGLLAGYVLGKIL